MEFRSDINGLRALSVLAVALYHFGVPGFSGGFVGVDVFFVISGYLMTAIILMASESGNFSLLHFYLSRARRIVPALFVLCVTLLILSWYYILPVDFEIIAKGALSSITFVSNIVYWQETGYFDAISRDNWLLHTWSLSVEWQFYILYPIVLGTFLRFCSGLSAVRLLLAIACGASLLLSIVAMRWPVALFYLLPTRAWELLAGGLVYTGILNLPPSSVWRPTLEGVGFMALALSVSLFHPGMPWPGYMAIVPVVGCVLIIAAEHKNAIWSTHPLSRLLGRWSYSIYLWHWPIVLAIGYFLIDPGPVTLLLGVVAAVALGGISYSVAEQSIGRFIFKIPAFGQICIFLVMVGTVSWASSAILLHDGFPGRVPPAAQLLTADTQLARGECSLYVFPIEEVAGCHLGEEAQPETVMLIGDSHALSLIGAVDEALKLTNRGGRVYTAASCAPLLGMQLPNRESDCVGFYDIVRSKPFGPADRTTIILAGRWSAYLYGHNEDNIHAAMAFEGIDNFDSLPPKLKERIFSDRLTRGVCQFSSRGKVYVVAPIPEMKYNIPKMLARDAMLGGFTADKYDLSRAEHERRNRVVEPALMLAGEKCGATILNPADYLCDADSCHGTNSGRPIYIDSNHINKYGNRLLVPMFKLLFQS